MFKEIKKPSEFPCYLGYDDERYTICSDHHYIYLNEKADKLYQVIHGYISQPDLDYFCSTHPQENNCFMVALIMDEWCKDQPFNED